MMMSQPNELETCLINACKDEGQRYHFYETLLNSDIYFLPHTYQKPLPAKEQRMEVSDSIPISIMQIEFEGERYIPFFSSLECIHTVISDEGAYYKLTSLDFFKMIRDAATPYPLTLNHGSAHSKIFTLDEIERLANGNNPAACEEIIASAGDRILLGQPNNYPYQLVETLKKNFKKNRHIKQAFLAQMFNPSIDKKPHTLLIIDTKDDFNRVGYTIGALLNTIEIPEPPVDITQFHNSDDPISNYCLEIKPFYKKKILGIF